MNIQGLFAAHTENKKHLADTHQENSDKIVSDCVEVCVLSKCPSMHTHLYKNMNEHAPKECV